jgi:hypothetical protein
MTFHRIASWHNLEYVCHDQAEILTCRSDWHQFFNALPIIPLCNAAKTRFEALVKKWPAVLQKHHASGRKQISSRDNLAGWIQSSATHDQLLIIMYIYISFIPHPLRMR